MKLQDSQRSGSLYQSKSNKNKTEMQFNKMSMIHNDDFSQMNREPEETVKYEEFPTPKIVLSE